MTALQRMIEARNMKQVELARKLCISRAAVSMQVRKGIRSVRTAQKYGRAMDCNPLLLIDGLGGFQ